MPEFDDKIVLFFTALTPLSPRLRGGKGLGDRGVIPHHNTQNMLSLMPIGQAAAPTKNGYCVGVGHDRPSLPVLNSTPETVGATVSKRKVPRTWQRAAQPAFWSSKMSR